MLCVDADEQKGKKEERKKLTLMQMAGQWMCCMQIMSSKEKEKEAEKNLLNADGWIADVDSGGGC